MAEYQALKAEIEHLQLEAKFTNATDSQIIVADESHAS
jgi:hypothetical protein